MFNSNTRKCFRRKYYFLYKYNDDFYKYFFKYFIYFTAFKIIYYIKGLFHLLCLLLVIFYFIFYDCYKQNIYYMLYIVCTFIIAIIFIAMYINYGINYKILNKNDGDINKAELNFILLNEHLDDKKFNDIFKKICFSLNIKYDYKNIEQTYLCYLIMLSKIFKADYDKNNNKKSLFYTNLLDILYEMRTTKEIKMKTLFTIKQAFVILQKKNTIYYFNLRYYYQHLIDNYSIKNNCNYLIYNYSINDLNENICIFLANFKEFLNMGNNNTPKHLINFSKAINFFEKYALPNYKLLSDNGKDEYQKILYRLIIEGLLNCPINSMYTALFIEEISAYEDILNKQFNSNKYLLMKLDFSIFEAKIIKVSKEFNESVNKSINHLFPKKFSELGEKLFFRGELSNNNMNQKNNITKNNNNNNEDEEEIINQKDNNNSNIINKDIKDFNFQSFHFIIEDNKKNIKYFVYDYRLYPSLLDLIGFLDGYYYIGDKDLLVTQCIYDKEYIINISYNISKLIYINQEYIDLLDNYGIKLEINEFNLNSSKKFKLKNLVKYLNEIKNNIINICYTEDIDFINKLYDKINHNNTVGKNNSKKNINPNLSTTTSVGLYNKIFQFKNVLTILDNDRNNKYNVYSLEEIKNKSEGSFIKTNIENIDGENEVSGNQMSKYQEGIINSAHTHSSNDNSQNSIGFGIGKKFAKKKKNGLNSYLNKTFVLTLFNFCIVILAALCLIIQNNLNNKVNNYLEIFRASISLTRYTLITILSFFSILCNYKIAVEGLDICENIFESYFQSTNNTDLIKIFNLQILILLDDYSEKYNSIARQINKNQDNEIKNYLVKATRNVHIYYNGATSTFDGSYYTDDDDIGYCIQSFINKLTVVMDNHKDDFITVYPLKTDENLIPSEFLFKTLDYGSSKTITSLSSEQIYVYEISLSFYIYVNDFYRLDDIVYGKIDKQINNNQKILLIFLIVLMVLNLIISITCLIFIRNFSHALNERFNTIDEILNNKDCVDILKNKVDVYEDLSKFYYDYPMKILQRLNDKNIIAKKKESVNKLSGHKNKNNNDNNEDDNLVEKKKKQFDVNFIFNKFKYLIIGFYLVFILYFVISYIFYNYSFEKIRNITLGLRYISFFEQDTYFILSVAMIYSKIAINPTAFTQQLTSMIDMEHNKLYFHAALHELDNELNSELMYQYLKNYIPSNDEILKFNCDSLFKDVNDDKLNALFNYSNETKGYQSYLTKFCKDTILNKYQSLTYLRENILLRLSNLILPTFSTNGTDSSYDNVKKYNVEDLSFLTMIVLFIFRPLETYYSDYYFKTVLKNIQDSYFIYLIGFLGGNIALQVIYLFVIKNGILGKIEATSMNLDKLIRVMNIES